MIGESHLQHSTLFPKYQQVHSAENLRIHVHPTGKSRKHMLVKHKVRSLVTFHKLSLKIKFHILSNSFQVSVIVEMFHDSR
jgi:hypothetical protein